MADLLPALLFLCFSLAEIACWISYRFKGPANSHSHCRRRRRIPPYAAAAAAAAG